MVTLKGFGDESADAKKERVFAVACVLGTEDEWGLAVREWLRRTRGLPFHATDCEAVQGPERQGSLDLYRDLTQILVRSHLVGWACALNLHSYRSVFGHSGPDPDWPYFKAFGDIIGQAARTAKGFSAQPGEPRMRLEFTFDSRLQSNGTAGILYSMLANHPDWTASQVLDNKVTFESGAGKSPRLEMGDLLAHESMKELDRRITGMPSKVRASYTALKNARKFHFVDRDVDYWNRMKAMVEQPESVALMQQFDDWLIERGMVDRGGIPARHMTNWFLFNSWLDNKNVLTKKADGTSFS